MFDNLIAKIRRHSREDYRQLVVDGFTEARIWVQEHGEQSAVLGVVIGVAFILFFKIFFWAAFLLLCCWFVIWFTAQPESEMEFAASEDLGSKVEPVKQDGESESSAVGEEQEDEEIPENPPRSTPGSTFDN
jgi:hypothetical protein